MHLPSRKRWKNVSGVYRIVHHDSGREYIGSTRDLYERAEDHRRHLREGAHHSPILQNAFNKYGETSFSFEVLDEVEEASLLHEEQRLLDSRRPYFNASKVAVAAFFGKKHSAETKRRIARKMRGNKNAVGADHSDRSPVEDAVKAAISSARRQFDFPNVVTPDGRVMKIAPSLNSFCLTHGLTRQGVSKLLAGKIRQHKGWSVST